MNQFSGVWYLALKNEYTAVDRCEMIEISQSPLHDDDWVERYEGFRRDSKYR